MAAGKLIVLLLLAVPCISYAAPRNDNLLAIFLRKTIEEFRSKMTSGIPDIDVPVLDPFAMEDKELEENDDKAKLKASLTDVIITGLSDFSIETLDVDTNTLEAELELHFKTIKGEGNYKVDGTVMTFFPITGDGPFWVKAIDVSSRGKIILQSDGKYLQIVDAKLELTTEEISGHFENILGGGELGEVFNLILNKFGKNILDSYSPTLLKKVTKSLQEHANAELKNIPIDDLLPGTSTAPVISESTSYDYEDTTEWN